MVSLVFHVQVTKAYAQLNYMLNDLTVTLKTKNKTKKQTWTLFKLFVFK